MMNETITSLCDLPQNEREAANVIIEIIKGKHAKHEKDTQEQKYSKSVPLEKIHFGIDDFEDFCNVMQGIAPYQDWKKTARSMFGSLSGSYRQIEPSRGCYRLTKQGFLYREIKAELALKGVSNAE